MPNGTPDCLDHTLRRPVPLFAVGLAAALGTAFLLDALTPREFGAPFLYVFIVWAGVRRLPPRQARGLAAACGALLLIALAFPGKTGAGEAVLVSRGLGLFTMAFIVYYSGVRQKAIAAVRRHECDFAHSVDSAAAGTEAEKSRREQEELLRITFDAAPVGISISGPQGNFIRVNTAYQELVGYNENELMTQSGIVLTHPDERPESAALRAELLAGKRPFFEMEKRYRRKDGQWIWIRNKVSLITEPDGTPRYSVGVVQDITARKLAEEALRESERRLTGYANELRRLAGKLTDLQEQERRDLSRELHDRVGQNLTALNINLNILGGELGPGAGAGARKRVADSLQLVEQIANCIEDVMTDLRPPMLDDYGLLAAIRWHAKQFARRTGIETRTGGADLAVRLPPEAELALFRITQEALNNLAKHARAHWAYIDLRESAASVRLTIADDGVGFTRGGEAQLAFGGTWGMITMRERAAAAGGRLDIQSVPGKGTRLTVEVDR